MIVVKKAKTSKDFKDFVNFPFDLYKNSKYWVPPISKEELNTIDKSKNPVFKNAEAEFFLAYKKNKIVGRIAAIVNWVEVKEQKKNKLRFGWYDVIDDLEVSKKLIDEVISFGKQRQLSFIEGPVGFSNMDKAGLLTHGFDELNTMITWYHNPYQMEHLKKLKMKKLAEWVEYRIQIFDEDKAPQKVKKFSDLIENNPEYIIQKSVKGMLPKNKLAARMLKRLKVYANNEHPHEAQFKDKDSKNQNSKEVEVDN